MPGIQFLFRGQKFLAIFGGIYLGILLLLTIPFFQSQYVIYLNEMGYFSRPTVRFILTQSNSHFSPTSIPQKNMV